MSLFWFGPNEIATGTTTAATTRWWACSYLFVAIRESLTAPNRPLLPQVEVMEVDSRKLFLLTGDMDAVVVFLSWSEFIPLPHQLSAALREGDH